MKLVTYCRDASGSDSDARPGVMVDGRIVDFSSVVHSLANGSFGGILALLHGGPNALAMVRAFVAAARAAAWPGPHPRVEDVTLLAPIPRPGKIIGVGRNYADHAAEIGVTPAVKSAEKPRLFTKVPSCVVGPGAIVRRPTGIVKLDYEVELAVVIGTRATAVTRERALEHVAGYTILNDVSAREYQFDLSPPQTSFAKSMDGFCPMGPCLATADEIGDPRALTLTCHVNGEERQHGTVRDLIFDIPFLIEYLSRVMTLEPGDVIATGTPAGVAAFRKPPAWLVPGDRVRMEISGIGVLEHTIG
jgi:2-keto-4-pentenoate hydratase/2-oxohepta-3-ene-1,7-dioic acid hydratase in catechol pathway